MKQIRLPDIGEGLTEGEIVEWLVKEGERVKRFQPIVRVLTAKATVDIPTPHEGTVVRLLAQPGDVVKVGDVIAEIEEAGEETGASAAPSAKLEAEEIGEEEKRIAAPPIKAPPRVRRLAAELGVDLGSLRGSGPGGAITEDDVKRAAEARARQSERVERIPLRGVKRLMSQKMSESKAKIPHAYIAEEVDFTSLLELKEALKEEAESKGVKLTVLSFLVKAVTKALKKYPLLNATFDEASGEVVVKKYYNIGIAIDAPDGLVVPNIKDADKKGLFQIAREIAELSERARRGALSVDDVRDGTFSITNIGSIGTVIGMAVINYPEAAILGLHRIYEAPRYVKGELRPRMVGYVTLSFDHRFIEGAYASRFLLELKRLLETPALILSADGELE